MDKLCIICRKPFKFKNEVPRMCCAGGEVKLPELHTIPITGLIATKLIGATCGYFKYHLDAFHKFNDEALFYTAPNICLQMNLINIKKTSNLQKDVVNKNEEENH